MEKKINFKSKETIFSEENDEISLYPLLKLILRNKTFIIFFTIFSAITSIFYSNSIKPTFRGSFEIVVSNDNNEMIKAPTTTGLAALLNTQINNPIATQELILKSPSVLNPVFEFVKDYQIKKGSNVKNLSFKKWLKSDVDIKFEENTNILSVQYLNEDRELIIKVLNLISKKYQDFSKLSIEREINQAINYLEDQVIINQEKLNASFKKLSIFSINNGIGSVQGFAFIEQLNTFDDEQTEDKESKLKNKNSENKRYRNLYQRLENYETQYKDLLSTLKPNSKYMKSLESKINNLREALKKPNEILLTFNQLEKDYLNQEIFLNNIKKQLAVLKFRKAKQLNPWELISNPSLENQKISPNKKNIVMFASAISFLISIILAYIFYKKKGILFDSDIINRKLSCEMIETLDLNNFSMSVNFFENSVNQLINKDLKNIGLFALNSKNINNFESFINKVSANNKSKNISEIDLFDFKTIKDIEVIILFIQSKNINSNELSLIEKYIKLNNEKVLGWFFLENKY